MIKCPFCGTHKAIERTGINRIQKDRGFDRPYIFSFDHIDLKESAFISVRSCEGRRGLPEIRRITLREAIKNGEYEDLRQSLMNQCVRILKILTGEEK